MSRHPVILSGLGEGVTEATLVAWLKQPGETVDSGEVIAEVMTDKVNLPVESPATGTLEQVLYAVDDVVKPGQILAFITEDDG